MKRFLVVLLLLLLVSVVVAGAAFYFSSGSSSTVFSGGNKILALTLSGTLPDYVAEAPLPFSAGPSRSLANLYLTLESAAEDDSVVALAVTIDGPRIGLARAQEVRRLLLRLRDQGKRTECFLETVGAGGNGTLDYYLATACERITLAPAGDLNLMGLFWDLSFYRGTLDKLKVEPDFYQAGTYKGAGETFTRSELSPAAEESYETVLDDLYGQIVSAVAEARGLPAASVSAIINGAPYDADEALSMGMVDALDYHDGFQNRLEQELGEDPAWVELGDYARKKPSRGKVAVVFAQGTIVRGAASYDPWTQQRSIASGEIIELLDELAEDASVEAVVLRINSPGGSALASDLILRSVQQLAETKPVVVSMSDVAASGGYYIAARAHHVVAEAATITGSVGVVFGKVATRAFEQELLGISHDSIQRGDNANYFSILDRFSEPQSERVRTLIERTYRRFTQHVAEGRQMTPEAVERAAQGRIWTGTQALDLGLVDELGGLSTAIETAAEKAGLDPQDAGVAFFPRPPSFWRFLEERQAAQVANLLQGFSLRLAVPQGLELPADAAALSAPF